MQNQIEAHAILEKDSPEMRMIFALGVILLMFGPIFTGSPKSAIAGIAILIAHSLI
jgi:hypothetical protein